MSIFLASVDAISMYCSIKLTTINKAVIIFTKGLTTTNNKKTNLCLNIIHFGMRFILIFFDGEYYKYHGCEKIDQG